MTSRAIPVYAAVALAIGVAACGGPHQPRPGTVLDEAMRAGVAPKDLDAPPTTIFATWTSTSSTAGGRPSHRSKSRVATCGYVWTGGNDRLWDRLTIDSLGTFDSAQDDLVSSQEAV